MDPLSAFFSVFTLTRIINAFIFGIVLGHVFNPTNIEIYRLALYLFLFVILGFSVSLISGSEASIFQGIAMIFLGGISNVGLIVGRRIRGINVLERKRDK